MLAVERKVRVNPNSEIGREGDDSIENAEVVSLLDCDWEVTSEERTVVERIDQNLPLEIPKHNYVRED